MNTCNQVNPASHCVLQPFAHLAKDRRLDWRHAVSPGGMPSSHTAFVVGMATAVGWFEGTSSAMFAVSAVLAMVGSHVPAGTAGWRTRTPGSLLSSCSTRLMQQQQLHVARSALQCLVSLITSAAADDAAGGGL